MIICIIYIIAPPWLWVFSSLHWAYTLQLLLTKKTSPVKNPSGLQQSPNTNCFEGYFPLTAYIESLHWCSCCTQRGKQTRLWTLVKPLIHCCFTDSLKLNHNILWVYSWENSEQLFICDLIITHIFSSLEECYLINKDKLNFGQRVSIEKLFYVALINLQKSHPCLKHILWFYDSLFQAINSRQHISSAGLCCADKFL